MSSAAPTLNHDQPTRPQKRKLALVKCERCRLDKQKCLPVDRAWPAKCNRCTEKDFTCSEGRRIERRTKHLVSTAPIPSTSNHLDKNETPITSKIQLMLKQRATLLSYQKLMDMAIRRLATLKFDTIKPFLTNSPNAQEEFEKALRGSPCVLFDIFYNELEATISKLTADLLTTSHTTISLSSTITTDLISQTTPTFLWQTSCPICFDTGDSASLQALAENGNATGEYVVRLSRIARHLSGRRHWEADAPEFLDLELRRISALSFEVESVVTATLKELDIFDCLPALSQSNLIFHPDEINYEMWLHEKSERDCLGRTGLHQYLDTLRGHYPNNFKQILALLSTDYINQQDILGRTALHIACQKGWEEVVRLLLEKGADRMVKTVFGSLPLHYAAVGSRRDIYWLLMQKGVEEYEGQGRDCRGLEAGDYRPGL
ncbi:hypothetical protein CC80DRAFT_531927 [Byssothecium circinans]|uniref:Uncharacterized protein n=1 Tax=Byssothecium circinans TaxID=147558 RepID=A0A6A5U8M5_9PLEO|nr:hypothetical protein CC80DRAFT_531927 [Byssothecium circinans]